MSAISINKGVAMTNMTMTNSQENKSDVATELKASVVQASAVKAATHAAFFFGSALRFAQ